VELLLVVVGGRVADAGVVVVVAGAAVIGAIVRGESPAPTGVGSPLAGTSTSYMPVEFTYTYTIPAARIGAAYAPSCATWPEF